MDLFLKQHCVRVDLYPRGEPTYVGAFFSPFRVVSQTKTPDEEHEYRERFFQKAQAAGRLLHPWYRVHSTEDGYDQQARISGTFKKGSEQTLLISFGQHKDMLVAFE